jgi:hypothetical protein
MIITMRIELGLLCEHAQVPFAVLCQLAPEGPLRFTARKPHLPKFRDELAKMAAKIAGAPWHMPEAARWVQAWLSGQQSLCPPLRVEYVAAMVGGWPRLPLVRVAVRDEPDALEPAPNELRVQHTPKGRLQCDVPDPPPSAHAKFVYPTAVHLWSTLGHSWLDARQMAEDMWVQLGPGAQLLVLEDDAAVHDSDVEVDGL